MEDLRIPTHCREALRIARDRQKKYGNVLIPARVPCVHCKKFHPLESMNRIENTGIVRGVMDCFCRACAKENSRDFSRMSRIVCAGCREVVAVVEPGTEVSGFVWQPGKCVHVAKCPKCSGDAGLTMSPIAEKIAFYNARGIPYEKESP